MKTTSLLSKKAFLLIGLILFSLVICNKLMAQAPKAFNYQGVARDADKVPIANVEINLRTSLVQGSEDGSVQYQETQSVMTSDRGLFVIRIGEGTAEVGSIDAIDWSSAPYFIKIEMDPAGGTEFRQIGASKLYSVPYALYADKAGNSDDDNKNDFTDKISLKGENGNDIVRLEPWGASEPNLGSIAFFNDQGEYRAWMGIAGKDSSGQLLLRGPNGNGNVLLTPMDADPNLGSLRVLDEEGKLKGWLGIVNNSGRVVLQGPNGNNNLFIEAKDNVGQIYLKGENGNNNVSLTTRTPSVPNLGAVRVFDEEGKEQGELGINENQGGFLNLSSSDGKPKIFAGSLNNSGELYLKGPINQNTVILKATDDIGILDLNGPNGNAIIKLRPFSNPNRGEIAFYDDGYIRAGLGVDGVSGTSYANFLGTDSLGTETDIKLGINTQDNRGEILFRGKNSTSNVRIGPWDNENPNHGSFDIFNQEGNFVAYMGSDPTTDKGVLWVDGPVTATNVSNFVDNPEKSGEKIAYSLLQGPEAASYIRGTATLVNGRASIDFPKHFSQNILSEGITVSITPLSAESKGIAVVKKGTNGIRVTELLQGQGNYEFDWEVKAKRKISIVKSTMRKPSSKAGIE